VGVVGAWVFTKKKKKQKTSSFFFSKKKKKKKKKKKNTTAHPPTRPPPPLLLPPHTTQCAPHPPPFAFAPATPSSPPQGGRPRPAPQPNPQRVRHQPGRPHPQRLEGRGHPDGICKERAQHAQHNTYNKAGAGARAGAASTQHAGLATDLAPAPRTRGRSLAGRRPPGRRPRAAAAALPWPLPAPGWRARRARRVCPGGPGLHKTFPSQDLVLGFSVFSWPAHTRDPPSPFSSLSSRPPVPTTTTLYVLVGARYRHSRLRRRRRRQRGRCVGQIILARWPDRAGYRCSLGHRAEYRARARAVRGKRGSG